MTREEKQDELDEASAQGKEISRAIAELSAITAKLAKVNAGLDKALSDATNRVQHLREANRILDER